MSDLSFRPCSSFASPSPWAINPWTSANDSPFFIISLSVYHLYRLCHEKSSNGFGQSFTPEDIRDYPPGNEAKNEAESEPDNEVCSKYTCRSALPDYSIEHILTLISFRHPPPAITAVYHFYVCTLANGVEPIKRTRLIEPKQTAQPEPECRASPACG